MDCKENLPNCHANCCRFIAQIVKPELKDYYLMHENIFVKEQHGFVLVVYPSKCKNLDENGLCKIYDSRPQVCQDAFIKDIVGSLYMPHCIYTKPLLGFDITEREIRDINKK